MTTDLPDVALDAIEASATRLAEELRDLMESADNLRRLLERTYGSIDKGVADLGALSAVLAACGRVAPEIPGADEPGPNLAGIEPDPNTSGPNLADLAVSDLRA